MLRLVLATTIVGLTLFGGVAESQEATTTKAKTALVVPFGVSSVDAVKLSASLTEASRETLARSGANTDVAKAPLVDILTLIECPSGGDECIGGLAEALDVDLALTGRVVVNASGSVAEVVIIKRDGSIEKMIHLLAGVDLATKARAFKIKLGAKIGVATEPEPRPTSAGADVSQPTTSAEQGGVGVGVGVGVESAEAPTTSLPVTDNATEGRSTAPPTSGVVGSTATSDPRTDQRTDRRGGLRNVRPLSWGVTAGGVVALGVGTVFYAMAKSTEADVEDAPTNTRDDLERLRDLEDQGDRQKTTAGVFLTVGALATAAGVGLVVWDSMQPDKSITVSMGPTDSSGGIAATLTGSF